MAVHMTRSGVALTVGIIILAGLIIGGLFLVKHQGEQARRDEAVKIAERNLENRSDNEVALNEGDDEAEENKDESNTSSEATEVPQTGASESQEATGQVAEELPQTGAGDVSAVLAVGAITFAGVAYVRSRALVSER
jgi:FtsZ-interacting cell division protein ZipA